MSAPGCTTGAEVTRSERHRPSGVCFGCGKSGRRVQRYVVGHRLALDGSETAVRLSLCITCLGNKGRRSRVVLGWGG